MIAFGGCSLVEQKNRLEVAKELPWVNSSSQSPYASMITNSSSIQYKEFPIRHSISDDLIKEVRFLKPQDLKNNTETVIIVLGDRPLDDTMPTVDMVYRVLKGIQLATQFPDAIMIMSGGATKGHTPEARMMGLIAWSRGIDPLRIILEDKSQTTRENAKNTARIVGSKNVQHVLIVTEQSRIEDDSEIFHKFDKDLKDIKAFPCAVTKAVIINQMERYLINHDDRVVRGRLHYVKRGLKYKAYKFVVIPAE
ncbi:MAG: YdcF family protein [Candidatus Omnitrophica bacterium]|nr:YdcF family protein [Candidatus Omnitrophota bacterium]